MLPKSVSPGFVPLPAAILAFFLCIPFIRLHNGPIKLIVLGENQGFLFLYFLTYAICVAFLVPKALSYLGIRVRGRSIERFQPIDRDEGEVAVELPIRSYRDLRFIRLISIILYFAGLVCLVLAWFLPAGGPPWDPWTMTITWLGFAIFLMIAGFLLSRIKPVLICELSEKGIRAPDGFLGRQAFVPWADLVRCEIIRDDETCCDHFLLWDRRGLRRFKQSKDWMGRLTRSERTRIFRALKAQFPRKAKPDRNPEPAMAGVASSAVWDRELDG